MRIAPSVLLAVALLAAPAPAPAQTGAEPTLVLTIFGGALTGHSLWTVGKQPLCVFDAGTFTCSSLDDTLRLSRSVSSSLLIGVSASYYPYSRLGFQADVAYLGMPLETSCGGVFFHPDGAERRNEQVCANINGSSFGSAIGFSLSALLRATPRRSLSPYLRVGFGLVTYARSALEVVGPYQSGGGVFNRQIVADGSPRRTSASAVVGAGFTSPIGTGYQFRLELRDVISSFERLEGAADALGEAPSSSGLYHHFALAMGVDIVLEKKRGRRY